MSLKIKPPRNKNKISLHSYLISSISHRKKPTGLVTSLLIYQDQ